jgi:hypothetical protein
MLHRPNDLWALWALWAAAFVVATIVLLSERSFQNSEALSNRDVSLALYTPCTLSSHLNAQPRAKRFVTLFVRRQNDIDDNEHEENEREIGMGMSRAFRQLDAMGSSRFLDDSPGASNEDSTFSPLLEPNPISIPVADVIPTTDSIAPEQEILLYRQMLEEVSVQDDTDLYTEMLVDISGDINEATEIAKSKIRSKGTRNKDGMVDSDDERPQLISDLLSAASASTTVKPKSSQDVIEEALSEAMQEIKLKDITLSTGSSIDFNDRELRKEIEAIFDRGNQQLMRSIEEMRQEQVSVLEIIVFLLGSYSLFCQLI